YQGLIFSKHIKNEKWYLKQDKTGIDVIIPLNNTAKAIINKYKHDDKLPKLSNPKYNLYLKELCKLAGLNEPILITNTVGNKQHKAVRPKWEVVSAHTSRKTFITTALEKGISINN